MKADNHLSIGAVRFCRVQELTRARPVEVFFREQAPGVVESIRANERWLRPYVDATGAAPNLLLTFQAFVIESEGHKILVDPCVGNDKHRDMLGGPLHTTFLDDLDAAVDGLDTIDLIACTHLHLDHVGWCTSWRDERWMPTFPNARHVIVGEEWDYWNFEARANPGNDAGRTIDDSVRPIVAAGLADFVTDDHRLTASVRFVPTAGHSPGHVSIEIASHGERALITGDTLHHPIQFVRPECAIPFDTDPARATAVRQAMTEELTDADTLVIGTHFAGPAAGHLRRDGEGLVFDPGGLSCGGSPAR